MIKILLHLFGHNKAIFLLICKLDHILRIVTCFISGHLISLESLSGWDENHCMYYCERCSLPVHKVADNELTDEERLALYRNNENWKKFMQILKAARIAGED